VARDSPIKDGWTKHQVKRGKDCAKRFDCGGVGRTGCWKVDTGAGGNQQEKNGGAHRGTWCRKACAEGTSGVLEGVEEGARKLGIVVSTLWNGDITKAKGVENGLT